MHIESTISRKDYWKLRYYPLRKLPFYMLCALLGVGAFSIVIPVEIKIPFLIFFGGWFGLSFLSYVGNILLTFWNIKSKSKWTVNYFEPWTWDISEDGATISTPMSKTEMQWQGFLKWGKTLNYYLLYISKSQYYPINPSDLSTDERANLERLLTFKMGEVTRK